MKQLFLIIISTFLGYTLSFGQTTTLHTAFEVTITGEGEPLFLIPGATCSGDVWAETVNRYAKQYECHVFTLAGYAGVTPLETTPILPTIKNALKDYIKEHKGNQNYIMGHSIGGFLSLWLASEMPNFFDNIVIVDGLPFFAALSNPAATADNLKITGESMLTMYNNMDSTTFVNNQKMVLKTMIQKESDIQTALNWSLTSDKKTMAYTMAEMMTTDLRDDIAKIQSKTLVLAAWDNASMGWFFKKEAVLQSYQDQYKNHPNCTVKIADNARHFIMYDNPTWFFQSVDDFLK